MSEEKLGVVTCLAIQGIALVLVFMVLIGHISILSWVFWLIVLPFAWAGFFSFLFILVVIAAGLVNKQ